MFDCVMPTRNGRHGVAFTRRGPINLKNARHADDPRPLDEASACAAARDYSRAYLHHLVKANEMLGAMLLSEVNLAYYQELMAGARAAIAAGRFERVPRARRRQGGRRATCRRGETAVERCVKTPLERPRRRVAATQNVTQSQPDDGERAAALAKET